MNNVCENIYKTARIRAEIRRAPAAEELGIAVRTLDKYENFELRVPDDIVKKMCYLYECPNLAWQHLKKSELGEFIPDVKETNIQSAALNMADDYLKFDDAYRTIIALVADGKIDNSEKERWYRLQSELNDFASSLLTLKTANIPDSNEVKKT